MILQNIVLILAIAAPVVLLILLRTNAAVVFFSLCAGALLVQYVGDDAGLAGSVVGNNSAAVSQYAQLVLLLLPVVLSAVVLRKSVVATKTPFNILPAIAVGLVGALLAVPLLPGHLQSAITTTDGWVLLERHRELVVAVSILVSLVVLWVTNHQSLGSHKKRHH